VLPRVPRFQACLSVREGSGVITCHMALGVLWATSKREILSRSTYLVGTTVLGTELSLSSRERMTLGVGAIFWFISHTLPQCHALQEVRDPYL
jgi:hypothetical protein